MSAIRKKLTELTNNVVEEHAIQYKPETVTTLNGMMNFPVKVIAAIVLEGKVRIERNVP